jgi:glycolate oxidase iron-sulfur subunit
MNSPRGRIVLMKETLEGHLTADEVKPFVDQCLGCVACETSCPSGVPYGELISSYRAWAEPKRQRTWIDRVRRTLLLKTLPYPRRLRVALVLGQLARPLRGLLPNSVRPAVDLIPWRLPPANPLPELNPARGPRRGRVALLLGCAQQVLAPEINRATVRVLTENGIEVVIPRAQGCCGALAMHVGEQASALRHARQNLSAFPDDVDAVITNAAGCGSGLHEYGLLFSGLPEAERARAFADRAIDVCAFLDRLGLIPPPAMRPLKVAYHDACHLAHAQGIRSEPRRLLAKIPGVQVVEPAEWEICCGSAGTYNLEQPELAARLGRRKADNLAATGAQLIVTGNIGCITQIQQHLRGRGLELPVIHTIELLARAYS